MDNGKFVAVLSCHVPRIQHGFQETDKHVCVCVSVYVQLSLSDDDREI
jgi:hypothetical protein